jgi:hypothetical protein
MGENAGVGNWKKPVSVETGPRSPARKWIALALLVGFAGLAVKTIDPGRVRTVVLLLLGFFALRIVLTASASR